MGSVPVSVSRRLLARLRDVMAGSGSPQERLDRTVQLIAADMVAEVCSCYVMRAGEVLELFATEGLKKSAVHQTRLRVGEGVVGDIAGQARPVALADAQSHPNFAYRPETGEEIYHSLMGVPIIRGGRVIGVLVVQNKSQRLYTEEEVETMETVAMVLAELVASGNLVSREELAPVDGTALLPLRLEGIRLHGGVGIGQAVLHQPRMVIRQLVAEDAEVELDRFAQAISGIQASLDALFAKPEMRDGEHRDVLETYRMFTEDKGWRGRISEAIRTGLTAEAAIQKVHEDMRVRMANISDPYLRERMHDFDDIADRLLHFLSGGISASDEKAELPPNAILVARTLGPMELFDYDYRNLRGLVMEEGSPTAHVVIVARALDIPVVGRCKDVLDRVEALDSVIVDGDNAQIFLRPPEDIRDTFAKAVTQRDERRARYALLRDVPAETVDGVHVQMMMNAGLLLDLQHLDETGAQGIGLYRTELPFMARPSLPNVEAQESLYRKIMDQAKGRPVVFRTLDVGGDKVLPYWNAPPEENPALGWRSIRITLDRPAVLRQQLRALVGAASGRDLSIMFPMIAVVDEFVRARALLDVELERLKASGRDLPTSVRVGTMLEVPALAFQLNSLLPLLDFISIGSNDLAQFLFAVDRGNPMVSERFDTLSPGFLSFIKRVVEQCDQSSVRVSVCGEMAGRPLEALGLLAVGIRSLSMTYPSLGPVKTMVRSTNLAEVTKYMHYLLTLPAPSIRGRLKSFAIDHGIII
jgi:phosphotransferase system enzyme I (PtsP)